MVGKTVQNVVRSVEDENLVFPLREFSAPLVIETVFHGARKRVSCGRKREIRRNSVVFLNNALVAFEGGIFAAFFAVKYGDSGLYTMQRENTRKVSATGSPGLPL